MEKDQISNKILLNDIEKNKWNNFTPINLRKERNENNQIKKTKWAYTNKINK